MKCQNIRVHPILASEILVHSFFSFTLHPISYIVTLQYLKQHGADTVSILIVWKFRFSPIIFW